MDDRPGPLGQVGGDDTERPEVVLAAFDHLQVVIRANCGSWRRAVSAARTMVVRSSDDPALDMGWPLRCCVPAGLRVAMGGVRGKRVARPGWPVVWS